MFLPIFKNLRVLDFSRLLPGPLASQYLVKMGAEVTCVTAPQSDPLLSDYTPFQALKKNKTLVSLDLKSSQGLAQAKELIQNADILLEGFRPQTMDRLGLDFEEVKKIQPKILYASLVGYPPGHPKYQSGGHDLNFLVDSGWYHWIFDQGSLQIPKLQVADILGGVWAAFQILMGRLQQAQAFQAIHLKISMVEFLKLLTEYAEDESFQTILPILSGGMARYQIYFTKDKKRLAMAGLEDKFWKNFLQAIDLSVSPQWSEQQIKEKISQRLQEKTLRQWQVIFEHVDACVSFIAD